MVVDCWAINRTLRLHYLDNQVNAASFGALFVPGLSSNASVFQPMLEALAQQRAISVSLRGRGLSDVPDVGYRFDDHVEDIVTCADHAQLQRICLIGHSIGVNYALGYALAHPSRVAGIIIGGYPPEFPTLNADWALRVMMNYPDELPMKAVLGIQYESTAISLWDRLKEIKCPVLVLRGGKSTSLLKPEVAARYQEYIPQAKVVVFQDSGHRLWRPNFERFMEVISSFMLECSS